VVSPVAVASGLAEAQQPGAAVGDHGTPTGLIAMPVTSRPWVRVVVTIGGIAIAVETRSQPFASRLRRRYAGFIAEHLMADFRFRVDLVIRPRRLHGYSEGLEVVCRDALWHLQRGDFRATWDMRRRQGWVQQTDVLHGLDAALRIVHSLILAEEGGFLVHAASLVRHGRAWAFAGVSGSGKTTMARLAPPDTTLFSDEVTYVRPCTAANGSPGYQAYGNPFYGELQKSGVNIGAPLVQLCLLEQGKGHRLQAVARGEAVRALLRHVMCFSRDRALANRLFESVCAFVDRVPVTRLTFARDPGVWELMR